MVFQVKDLSPELKRAAEILLGHPVSEDETVSIKSLGRSPITASKLTAEERIRALRALNDRFGGQPDREIGAEQEDEIVDEALRASRPNYRRVY